MKTPEEIAQEWANENIKRILEARNEVVEKAIALGYTPEDYYFEDNLEEVIDNPHKEYKVRLVRKIDNLEPRMKRGINDE